MRQWSKEDLLRINAVDDLHIAPFREDGVTFGTPTWIWSVTVDGNLYVRAYGGRSSSWYQAAVRQGAGKITAATMTFAVQFEAVDGPVNDAVDLAYRARYGGSPYVGHMVGAGARSATIRILPDKLES